MPFGKVKVTPEELAENRKKVRDISEAVYRDQLGPEGAERMIAKDKDNGVALRERSRSYDALTRTYLRILGRTP